MTEFKLQQYSNSVTLTGLECDGTYEPIPRLHGGIYKHWGHRFPIKGGIHPIIAHINNAKLRLSRLFSSSLRG